MHLAATCCLLLAAACGGTNSSSPTAAAISDSAGVRIVSYSHDDLARAPERRLADDPVVDIGADDSARETQFLQVRSMVPLRGGGFIVADGGSAELRAYDSTGGFAGRIGRLGDGPGEFRRIGWAARGRGDSIFVYDPQLQRISVFGDGRMHRAIPVEDPRLRFPFARLLLRDGSVVVEPQAMYAPASQRGIHRDTLVLYRLGTTGRDDGVLLRIPGEDVFVLPAKGGVRTAPQLFGRRVVMAAGDSVLYAGGTDTYEIRGIALTGATRSILRVTSSAKSVTSSMIAARRDRELSRIDGQLWQSFFRQMYDSMEYPAFLPQVSALIVDDRQRLWVRDFPAHPDSAAQWSVFDPDGTIDWRIRIPAAFELHAVAGDRLFGVWRDSSDVEHVRVYSSKEHR